MEPISTALAAFAAVQKVVSLIKQASKTADDVKSLGPLLGRYFDAKHTATKAVREAKRAGGSNMGKAIEIEMGIKQQADFEKQLNAMFFETGNMDVWQAIMARVQQMNKEDEEDARLQRIADRKAKKKKEEVDEIINIVLLLLVTFIVLGVIGWFVWEAMQQCSPNCGFQKG